MIRCVYCGAKLSPRTQMLAVMGLLPPVCRQCEDVPDQWESARHVTPEKSERRGLR